MFLKTKTGLRINTSFVVQIEELDKTDDGMVRCLLVIDGGEEIEVSISQGDLNRLDNGA